MNNVETTYFRKPADTQYPIHDLLRERWSPRAFSSQPVKVEDLYSLFEAARWAPSSGNLQPWTFIYATKEHAEQHARFIDALFPNNADWAQHAPVIMIAVAKLHDVPGKEHNSFYDLGMAVGNLMTQATHLGLIVHQMAGFDGAKAREQLNIPEGYVPLAMIAVGYRGSADTLNAVLHARELAPRTRKSLEEFAFEGTWKQAEPAENV